VNLSSPFIHNDKTTSRIMLLVCSALIPGILVSFYFFGWGTLINLVVCSVYAVSAEALIMWLRKKSIAKALSDNSALLTGLLIGLSFPPMLPWWMSFIGVWFAIIIAKQLYGGLGFNPFNPAMVGYVLLLISFPVEMTSWLPSHEIAQQHPSFLETLQITFVGTTSDGNKLIDYRMLADGFTMATPLDESKTAFSLGLMTSEIIETSHFITNTNSWFWLNISFLVGGLLLLANRVIHWHIPTSMLLGMTITASVLYLYDNQLFLSPWLHLTMGATMLGAFFIATDPVTASTTPKGRLIYGAIIGFFIVIIRSFGGYPDAVAFAVLLLNIAVPTIDHYTKPSVYGSQTRENINA